MATEIEKKYVIKDLSAIEELPILEKKRITQNYIAVQDMFECRIRHTHIIENNTKGERENFASFYEKELYEMTFKTGKGTVRQELTEELPQEQYNRIDEFLPYLPIVKIRTVYDFSKYGTKEIEVDEFKIPHGVCFAEIEFSNKKTLKEFNPPDFLGNELTIRNQFFWHEVNNFRVG